MSDEAPAPRGAVDDVAMAITSTPQAPIVDALASEQLPMAVVAAEATAAAVAAVAAVEAVAAEVATATATTEAAASTETAPEEAAPEPAAATPVVADGAAASSKEHPTVRLAHALTAMMSNLKDQPLVREALHDAETFEAHLAHARQALAALEHEMHELVHDEVATAEEHGKLVAQAVAAREAELRQAWLEERQALEARLAAGTEQSLQEYRQEQAAQLARVRRLRAYMRAHACCRWRDIRSSPVRAELPSGRRFFSWAMGRVAHRSWHSNSNAWSRRCRSATRSPRPASEPSDWRC